MEQRGGGQGKGEENIMPDSKRKASEGHLFKGIRNGNKSLFGSHDGKTTGIRTSWAAVLDQIMNSRSPILDTRLAEGHEVDLTCTTSLC